jgi:four helix bundle protein
LLRSGTSIGAQVRESKYAESKKDFIHKLKIGLKEAEECEYWILLLKDSGKIDERIFSDFHFKLIEVIKILRSIVLSSLKKN